MNFIILNFKYISQYYCYILKFNYAITGIYLILESITMILLYFWSNKYSLGDFFQKHLKNVSKPIDLSITFQGLTKFNRNIWVPNSLIEAAI